MLSRRGNADQLHRARTGPVESANRQAEDPVEELHRQSDEERGSSASARPTSFGACSPSTMCNEVMIENAITNAIECRHVSESPESGPSSSRAMAGSPTQPRAS